MNRPLLLRTALLRMSRYKAKTFAMGIGISIGVLAAVLLQAITGSVQERFLAFLDRAYPADGIVVFAGGGPMSGGSGRASLTLEDAETIAVALGIREWTPAVFAGNRDVRREGESLRVGVTGISEQAESVRRRSVAAGEFLSAQDVRSRASVVLIGSTTAAKLFPGESPIGAQLFIDNVGFEVKGVLESLGADPHGGDQDNVLALPYTTLLEKMVRSQRISGATFRVEERGRVEATSQEIARLLRQRHQIGEGEKDDFSVFTSASMQAMFARSVRTFKIFVPLIIGTAFLISALVILSILQISIRARTAEIGLRKAVGARPRDLETQILLEVLVVSAVAALVGVGLALAGAKVLTPLLAAKFGVRQVSPSLGVLSGALIAAIATGLLGGLLPARRAAKLRPVEALK